MLDIYVHDDDCLQTASIDNAIVQGVRLAIGYFIHTTEQRKPWIAITTSAANLPNDFMVIDT